MSAPAGFDLDRFVQAQAGTYDRALGELTQGRKTSHWMWFVFPQLKGLGASHMAHVYGLDGIAEARAFQAHPVLGPRLVACTQAMLGHAGTLASTILGEVDALKFRSCLTLFLHAAPDVPAYAQALRLFYEGQPDVVTERLLKAHRPGR